MAIGGQAIVETDDPDVEVLGVDRKVDEPSESDGKEVLDIDGQAMGTVTIAFVDEA